MLSNTTHLLSGLSLITLLATGCVITNESPNGTGGGSSSSSAGNGAGGQGSEGEGSGGDTTGTGGQGSGGGGTGGGGTGGDYTEQPGQPDNNDDRASAAEIAANGAFSLYLVESDQDWLKFSTPDDGKAHLITLSYTQPTDSGFRLDVLADADYSTIGTTWSDAGVKKTLYFTVGPNSTTLLSFERYGGEGGTYAFTIGDTPENDAQEPNNDREAAQAVSLDADIQGQLWIPYTAEEDQVSDDWFKVDLAAGEATIKLTHVPANQSYSVSLYDSAGVKVGTLWSPDRGATTEKTFTIEEAGTHYVQLSDYGSESLGGLIEVAKPASLSEQYILRIEQ